MQAWHVRHGMQQKRSRAWQAGGQQVQVWWWQAGRRQAGDMVWQNGRQNRRETQMKKAGR